MFPDITKTIGQTPLVRINRIIKSKAEIYAKLEFFNPLSSVKDRVGASMIEAAEKTGQLTQTTELVEPTSGNTGIALAFICAAKGYHLTLTMPESMSAERRALLKHLGANLVLTPAEKGMKGAIARAEELVQGNSKALMLQQFDNPANPEVHRQTTAEEIWKGMNGNLDVFVAGVGTGGTLTGVGEVMKKRHPKFHCVAVEPAESPVLSQTRTNQPIKTSPHKIQGIGAGFVPKNLNMTIVDEVITVLSEEAFEWARRAAREEGILCGISSGAALAAVSKLAARAEYEAKRIVVLLASSGERYLSTALFQP